MRFKFFRNCSQIKMEDIFGKLCNGGLRELFDRLGELMKLYVHPCQRLLWMLLCCFIFFL